MNAQMKNGTGTWDMNDVYRHPAYEEAYEMGKSV